MRSLLVKAASSAQRPPLCSTAWSIRCLAEPTSASRLAAGARERAVQEFSVEKLVVRNEEFYLHCLEEKACG
jgi:hypothetical protein